MSTAEPRVFWYDLHLHSCLSPCGDEDMTPNNIVGMARLKGLDIIAVADHNTVGQVASLMKVAGAEGPLIVPAMELCTAEEFHVLCYFPNLEAGLAVQEAVFDALPPQPNRPDIFGEQWLLDEQDEVTGREKRMLIAACGLDLDTVVRLVRNAGGVIVPAHIDRDSYSMLSTLGSIPEEYGFKRMELSKAISPEDWIALHPEHAAYQWLQGSDAHYLWDISEPIHAATLPELSLEALLKWLSVAGLIEK